MNSKELAFLLALGLVGLLGAADRLAVTTNKAGAVKVEKATTGQTEELKRGAVLYDQDKISTGSDGQALIMFLDDKSQLKLKGDTEVIITGDRTATGISKRINMDYGTLKASISEQRKGEFVISTPTSVASVKGTEFWIISDPDSGDVIVSNSGSIELVNSVTGETIMVPAGVIVESTADGQVNVLETIKISGWATTAVSGGQFTVQQIQILEGNVEAANLTGLVAVVENTVFEGAVLKAGARVTVRGAFDSQTGNMVATMVEVAEPMIVEAKAASGLMGDRFTLVGVELIQGSADSPPTTVIVTSTTAIEGGEVVAGATVTVTGYYNTETGFLTASSIAVVMPEKTVRFVKIGGTAETGEANNQFTITDIVLMDGNVDPTALSGVILVSDSTSRTGCEVLPGLAVEVEGIFNDSTGAVVALSVHAPTLKVAGTISTGLANNQFEITGLEVVSGEIEASGLSGVIKIDDQTEVDQNSLTVNTEVVVESCQVDPGTGDLLAIRIVSGDRAERTLIIKLEDTRGNKKELIITF